MTRATEHLPAPIALVRAAGDSCDTLHFDGSEVSQCVREGLVGLLDSAAADGRVELSDAGSRILDEAMREMCRKVVAIESMASVLVAALSERGIPCRVLKGVAVAHLDHVRPEDRPFNDIDLLVRSVDLANVVALLQDREFDRRFAEPFAHHDAVVGKGVSLNDRDSREVDLHRTLALGYYGTRIPIDLLWGRGEDFVIGGVSCEALAVERRFVHAALHLALSPTQRVLAGVDLARLAARVERAGLSVVDEAERWGCADPVARAVVRATGWLGPQWASREMLEWAEARESKPIERLWWRTYRRGSGASVLRSAAAVAGLRSNGDRLVVLRGHARSLWARGCRRVFS